LSVIGIKSAPESDNIQSPETCRRRIQVTGILPVQESGGRNSAGTGIRHRQPKFRPGYRRIPAKPVGSGPTRVLIRPGSDRILTDPAIDPAGSGRFRPESGHFGRIRSTFSPESGNGNRTIPATITKLLFLHFVIFSFEPNTEKYFRENHFF
jgi:hypothetical protein